MLLLLLLVLVLLLLCRLLLLLLLLPPPLTTNPLPTFHSLGQSIAVCGLCVRLCCVRVEGRVEGWTLYYMALPPLRHRPLSSHPWGPAGCANSQTSSKRC